MAVVLAGGLGTRLRSAVPDVPKVMAPVCGRPFLHHVLANVRFQGIDRIVLAVAHQREVIEGYFLDGRWLDMNIAYSDEGTPPRGTGGALRNVLDQGLCDPNDHVMVLNGDTLVRADLQAFRSHHVRVGASLSVVVTRIRESSRYGGMSIGQDGSVTSFVEKGSHGAGLINAGVYLALPSFWHTLLPSEPHYDLEKRILPTLVGRGLNAFVTDGAFIDIGIPEDYRRAPSVLGCEDHV